MIVCLSFNFTLAKVVTPTIDCSHAPEARHLGHFQRGPGSPLCQDVCHQTGSDPDDPRGSTTIADAVARSANATAASTDTVGAVVAATAIKVMTFWTKEPEQWFQNLEGQFEINRITVDSTKYYYVTQNLPQDIVCEVKS